MNILILSLILAVAVSLSRNYTKQTPVIGIYTQTCDEDGIDHFESYISAGYVKFV